MLMEKKLPKSIIDCPIVDSLIEIRFKSNINHNAIFGIIYNSLRSDFQKVENLPILQIPEAIRMKDPNLKYKPLYRISNKDFVVQIGPDVLAIGAYPKYVGWEKFSKTIFNTLNTIESLNIISEVERLGIRYINFFQGNIFDNIKLEINLGGSSILNQKSVFRTEINHGNFSSVLQISNDAQSEGKHGSIIDIDCSKTKGLQDFFKNKESLINEGHSKEKELFFDLIRVEYLNNFNPTY